MSNNKNYISTSLKRGLDILQLYDEENTSLSLSEISKKLETNRTVPYRLMLTSREEGYVIQDPVTKRYKLSPKILRLRYSYIYSVELTELYQPHLDAIIKSTET